MSVVLNVDFFKKLPGILKSCEFVLIMITMSLCASYYNYMHKSECFLLIASSTFFIGTFLMIVSSVFSFNTESRLRQTLFEPMYHFFALILIFSGSVAVLADKQGDGFMAAGGIGIVASIIYGVSAYDSYMAYITE